MSVGFVILNYNSYELTKELAQSISKYKDITNVILIDNCSTDDSYEKLCEIADKKIYLYKTSYNGGYSYGNNYGVNISSRLGNQYTFIANPDVRVDEKSIIDIIDVLKNSDYSLVTCLQYEIDGTLGKPAILRRNTYKDDLLDCFFITRKVIQKTRLNIEIKERLQEIEMFRGSFFAVNTSDFNLVGGFDENVFLYCEERILSKKFSIAQKKMGILTEDRYDHMHSKSINKSYNRYKKIKLLYKSRAYYNSQYNKKSYLKMLILKFSMKLSLCEYWIFDIFCGGK